MRRCESRAGVGGGADINVRAKKYRGTLHRLHGDGDDSLDKNASLDNGNNH
jgi:hypothetical protein